MQFRKFSFGAALVMALGLAPASAASVQTYSGQVSLEYGYDETNRIWKGIAVDPTGTLQVAGGITVTAGNVGGFTGSAAAAPTVTASSYSAGTSIGGLLTLSGLVRAGQTSGMLQKAVVSFADAQTPALDLILFNANPTGSTITDHTAVAVAAADLPKVIGVMHVNDCVAAGTPTICQAQQQAMSFASAASGGSLYGVLIPRAAITLGSTSDVGISVVGPQD